MQIPSQTKTNDRTAGSNHPRQSDAKEPSVDARPSVESTDTDLARNVRLFLSEKRSGFRRISVSDDIGTVTLSGPVSSFFLRQLAIVMAKHVAGVRHVVDELDVHR